MDGRKSYLKVAAEHTGGPATIYSPVNVLRHSDYIAAGGLLQRQADFYRDEPSLDLMLAIWGGPEGGT